MAILCFSPPERTSFQSLMALNPPSRYSRYSSLTSNKSFDSFWGRDRKYFVGIAFALHIGFHVWVGDLVAEGARRQVWALRDVEQSVHMRSVECPTD